ncbi:MAG: hypothetical protein IPO44_08015 [Candidatus Microthrix sp.]|nr:hypothetical protein [Candidatus Microthrix sp.]MBK9559488.1 hypothetical protein [Candidatus Microthrix sp.]
MTLTVGVRGELSYVWGKLRRTAHCSLCSITHGLTRERRSWTNWRDGVPVPVTVLHRNERDPDVEALSGDRTPCAGAGRRQDSSTCSAPGSWTRATATSACSSACWPPLDRSNLALADAS